MRVVALPALLALTSPALAQDTDDPVAPEVVLTDPEGSEPAPEPTEPTEWAGEPPPADDVAEAAPPAPADPYAMVRYAHGADAPARIRRKEAWDTWGELRGRVIGATDPALDDLGTTAGRSLGFTSRLIAGIDWRPTALSSVVLELEALNGQFAGDYTPVGTALGPDTFRIHRDGASDLTRFLPRKLYAQWLFPKAGQLTVGAQLFTWGTGMLANDGAGDPDFGDPNQGSVVARVSFATSPLRNKPDASLAAKGFTVFVSGDVVLRDETASLFDGDLAVQGIAGVRWVAPRVDLGGFFVARWQRDRLDPYYPTGEQTTVLAFPVDVYAKVLLTDPNETRFRALLEGEVVYIDGSTNRPWFDATFEDGARVQSLGAVGRVRFDHDPSGFTAKVEAGFASGDDDSRDDVVRTFTFHSDYNVGLLLFDEILPLMSARAVDRVADPGLTAVPPAGARYAVNQGAVSNAVYLNPVVRWRAKFGLDVRLGYLAAWSAGDFVDVYQTGTGGGYNTTPGGVTGGDRFFGHEVDLGLRYAVKLPLNLGIEVGAEGATFVPGPAFDGIAGDRLATQWLGRGRLAFTW